MTAGGERAEGFLQNISGELEEAHAEVHQSNQMPQSQQNAVDFSCSYFEKVQRDNDKLWKQVCHFKLELGQWRQN